ncbi:type II secretion system protein GspC [Kaarinaea lacus]
MTAWNDRLFSRMGAMKFDSRLPIAVTILMVIMLAQSLARLTWELVPRPEVKDNQAMFNPADRSGSDPGRKYQSQIKQISQWHLFGQKTAAPVAVSKVTEAPATRLNLKLRGVMASSDQGSARAIIADSKGEENSYAVGAELPGNAILKEIYPDRVILEYRGRLEMLQLPKEESVAIGFDSEINENSAKGEEISASTSVDSSTEAPNTIRSAQASGLLRQYREALVNDPQSLMNLVSAAPVAEEGTGKLKGYRIGPGKDKNLLRKFGLQNGDVITAVNGVPLDNPIQALEIMRDLSSASSISLDIERKGIPQSVSLQVD